MSNDLKERVKQVIPEHLEIPAEGFDDDTSFSQQLGLDSLDAMDLLLAIDEAFGVRIPAERMDHVDNLNQLVAALEAEQQKKSD